MAITPVFCSPVCCEVYGQARDGVRAYERYLAMLNRGM
jgi:hypothetical protein